MLMRMVFAGFVVLAFVSLRAEAQGVVTTRSQEFCGTEAAMAKLSPAQREALFEHSIDPLVPLAEILLYIHIPPPVGTIVRPGNPSSSGFVSSILSRQSTLPPPNLTATEIDHIIEQMKDDFSPFNIRVTTDYSEFLSYPSSSKLIHIVTTVPAVAGFSGNTVGIAPFVGIGFRMPSNPSFLFAGLTGNVADAANVMSHEVGHTLGLAHQHQFNGGACGIVNEYHPNIGGSGPLAFGILMGGAEHESISNWYSQECNGPIFGGPLRDFELISSQVVLTPDEFIDIPGSSLAGETPLPVSGVLGLSGDVDVIRVSNAQPALMTVASSNVDVEVSVFETDGTLIGTFNDPDLPGVRFAITSGTKDISIRAASNVNMDAVFMTGKYTLTQLVPTAATVTLSGSVMGHNGIAVTNAILKLHGPNGDVAAVARSNAFGYFRFENIMAGSVYLIETRHKEFQFEPLFLSVTDEMSEIRIMSMPQGVTIPITKDWSGTRR